MGTATAAVAATGLEGKVVEAVEVVEAEVVLDQ